MTTRDLIEALKDATRPEMREIRRLLAINAPEHYTLDEILELIRTHGRPMSTTGFSGHVVPLEIPRDESNP